MTIRLVIPGVPRGKARPRFVKATGRTFTDAQTMSTEQRVQTEWIAAGRPYLPEGPLAVSVELVLERPAAHWRKDGRLTNVGELHAWPTRRPDLDNCLKLYGGDALNGLAYRDDALIVTATVWKRWAGPGEAAHTVIVLAPAPVPALKAVA